MSLLRSLTRARPLINSLATSSQPLRTTALTRLTAPSSQLRHYAAPKVKKGKGVKSTDTIVAGSKQKIVDDAALAEYTKAETTMKTAVDWFRKECAGLETRASGRVTPAILAPVRVTLPADDSKDYKLEELATVGVREGSTLLITLFEEQNMKHIESALYSCNIPGVVPHKQDSRTIKVPIPKPTVESRLELYATAKKKAEEIKTQVRKQHSMSLKRGKFEKHSVEIEEFQKLTDKYVGEVDKTLKDLQKATGAK